MTLISLLMLACTSAGDDSGAAAPPDDVTLSAELIEASPSSIRVQWDLGETAVQQVIVRAESDAGDVVRLEVDPAQGLAVIWGLHPEAEVDVQVDLVGAEQTWTEDLGVLTTAPVPPELPALIANGDDPFPGELLLTTFVLDPAAAVLIDHEGTIRWWRIFEELPELTRVRVSPDGLTLTAVAANPHAESEDSLVQIPLSGGPMEILPVSQAHHDFVQLPDGTMTVLVHEVREVDGQDMIGDRILEIAPDGTQTIVFDAWETWTPTATGANPAGTGFTHGNHIDYDAARDQYLVSFFGRWTIDRIDRATGSLVWELGSSTEADFHTSTGSPWFIEGAHGFQLMGDRLLYFENGLMDRQLSRVVELELDEDNKICDPVWMYDNTQGLYSVSLGDVDRLDNGNTLVDFSTNGHMEVVTPDREVIWQLGAEIGGIFGYVERIADPAGG